ncbi:MAG: ATP-binding cassette domain-containing protein [Flavonifractor plautii]
MILEVEHLSFAYRPERPLFYDVSFAFEQGQVLSILGANGAGKSTLLNCIANLLLPQQGKSVSTGRLSLGWNCGRFPESSAMFPRATPRL